MSETNIASQTLPFAGRAAIVTGAASGIGLATVELLHRQGARIVAVGRGDNVNALAREGVVPVVADVAQEASAELAVQTAIGQFGRLDILVNNAGIIINRPVAEMSLEVEPGAVGQCHRRLPVLPCRHAPDDGRGLRRHRQHRLLRLLPELPRHRRLCRVKGHWRN